MKTKILLLLSVSCFLLCAQLLAGSKIINNHAATTIPGDSNCDGSVNVIDVLTTVNYIIGNNPQPFCFENADVNADGSVNAIDVIGVVNIILSGGGFTCGTSTITDVDGNIYNTVLIGNQCWMKENLKATRDAAGNNIIRYCFENNASYCIWYGGLYTWNTVMNGAGSSNGNPSGVKGICPTGWHVPSNAEWAQLVDYVVALGYPTQTDNPDDAGNALKSCRQVSSPLGGDCNTLEHPRWNSHDNHYGFDEFGFSGLPGGSRYSDGNFYGTGYYSCWWSSSVYAPHPPDAWAYILFYDKGYVNGYSSSKPSGFSVRCLRDPDAQTTLNLILKTNPPGTGTVTGAGQYVMGTHVNITAIANTGDEFVCWTDINGIVSVVPNFLYVMPAANVTLTANFLGISTPTWAYCPGTPTVTDIDGNVYNTVLINNQCWMKENLKTTKYRNGTPIEYPGSNNNAWQNNTTGAYAWYQNNISWKDSYGALYNWHAVNNSSGLCPTGWHVASDAEWTQLVDYVVAQGFSNYWYNPNGAGNALKSCRQVYSPLGGYCKTTEHPRWLQDNLSGYDLYGFDMFGFSAFPGGERNSVGGFNVIGSNGNWWSVTESSPTNAWYRNLDSSDGSVNRSNYQGKASGFSVRCLRD